MKLKVEQITVGDEPHAVLGFYGIEGKQLLAVSIPASELTEGVQAGDEFGLVKRKKRQKVSKSKGRV
ncbi:MAG: hypothetical protein WBV94_21740 [Blastocatellia bacterium]